MKFDILTLFPEIFVPFISSSIMGKAINKGLIEVNTINIRDFSKNKHKKVDDYPYGGGCGMVMTPQPIFDAYQSLVEKSSYKPHCIYLSPQGSVFKQETAIRLQSDFEHLVFLCGHYEGIDERVIEDIVDEEISIGDYVLTGGELPSIVIIDAVSRLIPGVIGAENGFVDESLYNGTIEYPQYTRPENYNQKKVPDVLLSGHHKNINIWKRKQSLIRTFEKRPDLFFKLNLSVQDLLLIKDEIPEKILIELTIKSEKLK